MTPEQRATLQAAARRRIRKVRLARALKWLAYKGLAEYVSHNARKELRT